MKNTLLLFLLSMVFGALIVSAQDAPPQNPPHLGTKNQYAIGSKNIPAKVYNAFLQEKASDEFYVFYSIYYDPSFMHTTADWDSIKPYDAIERSGNNLDGYRYSILPNHGDDIIDALNNKEVQQQFNTWYAQWLKNPTRDEVCAYFNAELSSDLEAAEKIKAAYPDAQKINFTQHQIIPQPPVGQKIVHCPTSVTFSEKTYFDLAKEVTHEISNGTYGTVKLPLVGSTSIPLSVSYEHAGCDDGYECVASFTKVENALTLCLNDPSQGWQRGRFFQNIDNVVCTPSPKK